MASNRVDIIVQRSPTGWRIDAYVAGTPDPIQHCEDLTALRFASKHHAERYARTRYGRRIATVTEYQGATA